MKTELGFEIPFDLPFEVTIEVYGDKVTVYVYDSIAQVFSLKKDKEEGILDGLRDLIQELKEE